MSKYYLYFVGYERVLPEFSQPIFLLNKKIKKNPQIHAKNMDSNKISFLHKEKIPK